MKFFNPNVLFWVNLVGAAFAMLCMTVTSRIPALAPVSSSFALGAIGFSVGMVANYLRLRRGSNDRKNWKK